MESLFLQGAKRGGQMDEKSEKEQEGLSSELMTFLAHDMRNGLGVMIGYAELLLEKADSHAETGENRHMLEQLYMRAMSMRSLLGNYLDLIQGDETKLDFRRHPVQIAELLRRVSDEYVAEARLRGVELTMANDLTLSVIYHKAVALERVFTNLIHNALKFTPSGGKVTVGAMRQDDNVVITVTDTGVGISPEDIPFVFDKYWSGKGGKQEQGRGLGLFIVKTFVDVLGGVITVDSTFGLGTCFSVSLPITEKL
jgi:two-component system, OmpR family, sensor histidine kinase ResE